MAALCSLALFGALLASSVDAFPLNARAPVNACFLHPAHLKTPTFRGATLNGTGVPSLLLHNGTRPHGNATGTGAAYPTSTGSILSANGLFSNSSVYSGNPLDGDCAGFKVSDDQVYIMVNGQVKIATLAPPPTTAAGQAKVIPIPANAPQYTYNYTSHSSHIKTTNTTNTTTTTIAYVYVGGKIATAQLAPAPKPVAVGNKAGTKLPISQQVTGTIPAAAAADSAATGSDSETVPTGNGQALAEKPDATNFAPQGDASPVGLGSAGTGSSSGTSSGVKAAGPASAKAGSGRTAAGAGTAKAGSGDTAADSGAATADSGAKAPGSGAAKAGSSGKASGLKGASAGTGSKAPATQDSDAGDAGVVSGAGSAVPVTGGQASGNAASDAAAPSQQASANPNALKDTILATAPDDTDTKDAKSDASSGATTPAKQGVAPGKTLSTGQSSSAGSALSGQGATQPVVPVVQGTTKLAATVNAPAVKPKAAAKAVSQYATYYKTVYSTSTSEEDSSTNSTSLTITPNQTPPLPAQSSIPACGVFVKLNGKTVTAPLAPVPAATNGSTIKISPDNVFVKANGQVQALPLAQPPANIASINNPPKKQPGVVAVTGLSSTTTTTDVTTDDKTCFVSIYGTVRKAPLAPIPAAQGTSKIPLVVQVPATADNSFKQTSAGDGEDLAYVYYQGMVVIASLAPAPGTVPEAPLPALNATTGLNETSAKANATGNLSSFLDTTKNVALNESTLQSGSVLSFSSPKNIIKESSKLSAGNGTAAAGTASPTGAVSPPVLAPLGGIDPVTPASTGTLKTLPASNGTLSTAAEKSGGALSDGAPVAPPYNAGSNSSSINPGPTAVPAVEYPTAPADTSSSSTTSSSPIASPTPPPVLLQSDLTPVLPAGSPTNTTSNSTAIAPGTAAPAPVAAADPAPAAAPAQPSPLDASTAPAQQAAAADKPATGTTSQAAPVTNNDPGPVIAAGPDPATAKADTAAAQPNTAAAQPDTAAASTQDQTAAAGDAAKSGTAPASAAVQAADAGAGSDASTATS